MSVEVAAWIVWGWLVACCVFVGVMVFRDDWERR